MGGMKLPRFSLRTLFVLIALGTFAAWAFWIGWPRWQLHREQMRFEEAAKEIRPGVSIRERPPLPWGHVIQTFDDPDDQGNVIVLERYDWPNVTYFICYTLPFDENNSVEENKTPFTKVRVYKFSTLQRGYQPKTARGKRHQLAIAKRNPSTEELAQAAFIGDFFTYAIDPTSVSDFPCELIYSDPHSEPPSK